MVVINSDFLRVTHYAYPVKFKWFYKQQYNGYVAIHDDYGGAEYDVNWITENKAVVKIIYFFPDMPDREGSNPDREITVTFK
ncbi:MAG: hypothetical protein FWF08_03645 [Oscillospiraceae bacterium]|nr:hypothetical protein [Oscillospiraceae bacterium]